MDTNALTPAAALSPEMFRDRGCTIWLTGLPCSGKTTLADALQEVLRAENRRVEVLDGDVVRTNLSKGLGFSREDRDTNIRRVGFVCNLLARNGVVAIAAFVSPYRSVRDEVRAALGDFVEVFVNCSVERCIERDVKGMYARALRGEIRGFTGVDDPYEEPLHAEVVVDTDREPVEACVSRILDAMRDLGHRAPINGKVLH